MTTKKYLNNVHRRGDSKTVGIWIMNIWIKETSEEHFFRSQVFRSSVIQIPSFYYLPGKKLVDRSDHLVVYTTTVFFLYKNQPMLKKYKNMLETKLSTIWKPNKMAAILFFYHSKTDFWNVQFSNRFGFQMFGIRAPTVLVYGLFQLFVHFGYRFQVIFLYPDLLFDIQMII